MRFLVLFGVLLSVLLGGSYLPVFESKAMTPYLLWSADVSAAMLESMGFVTTSSGAVISSPEFSIEVRRGCDAYEPIAIFIAALLAFPATWRSKLCGALAGIALLVGLNFVRLVSLFYIGVRFPDFFDAAHVELWQALFIILSMVIWMVWASRSISAARKRSLRKPA